MVKISYEAKIKSKNLNDFDGKKFCKCGDATMNEDSKCDTCKIIDEGDA